LQNITAILELLRQKCSQVYNLLDSAVIFSKPKYQLPVADPGSFGQLPPKPLWRPFATNAPLFGAHGSKTDQKIL